MKNVYLFLKRIILIVLLLVSIRSSATYMDAQTGIRVTGKVVNEEGKPVLVTISVKGTLIATMTDETGTFVLDNIKGNAILIISGVNIEPFEVEVKGQKNLGTLKAKTKISRDEEVVVEANTGYYSRKPNQINGAVVVIDNKTLNQQNQPDILKRLDGVASGIAFNNKHNNNPQSDLGITIRGLSTINGPLNPLVVLDNFIYEGDIRNINPADIESVTILKDAAATSIYGARGGNGVIVLTSKKGKFRQPLKVDVNTSVTFSAKPDLNSLPAISPSDYIDVEQFLYRKGFYDDIVNYNYYYHYPVTPALQTFINTSNGMLSPEDSAAAIKLLKSHNIKNEYGKFFYSPQLVQQYSLGLSDGSENNAFNASIGYNGNEGSLKELYNKLNIRIANTFRPLPNLKIDLSAWYTNAKSVSGAPASVDISGKQVPYLSLADSKGQPVAIPSLYDQSYIDTVGEGKLMNWNYYPLDDYKHNRATANTEELVGDIGLQYRILKGVNISLKYRYEKQSVLTRQLSDTASFATRDLINRFTQIDPATGNLSYIVPVGSILGLYNQSTGSTNLRGQLDFNHDWKHHSLSALFGVEQREIITGSQSSTVYGYNKDPLTSAAIDNVNEYPTFVDGSYQVIPGAPTLTSTTNRFISLYSNVAWLIENRYSFSWSGRKDGANIFGANTNDQWKPLWSAGIGWVLSREKFYSSKSVSYLRLKATYGYSGNVDLSKTSAPLAFVSTDYNTNLPFTRISTLNNPDLKWEQNKQINMGVEFSAFGKRIRGEIDYYLKKGTDLYGSTPYDYTAWGATNEIVKNVAAIKGHGLDINIQTVNIRKNVVWTTDFIVSYNKTKTVAYYTSDAENGISLIGGGSSITPVIGKPLYAIAAYKWEGLDNAGDPQGYLHGKPTTDYKAIIDDVMQKGLSSESTSYIGPATPVTSASIINTFGYKGLELSVNLDIRLGYYFQKPTLSYTSLFYNGVGSSDFDKRWKKPGDELITQVPALVYTDYPQFSQRDQFYGNASINVLKADNIRIRYINISYSFQGKNQFLKHSQIFANIANLGIIWRANKEGLDPDYPASLSPLKSYSFGLRTDF
jgi:TonB-dependent starch-binding outer membrane protein SusC